MRIEQFKLLSAARALSDFTKSELVEKTGVKKEAVNSFFKRHANRFFEHTGEKRRSGGVGPSAGVWRINESRRPEIDALLDTTRGEVGRELIDPKAAAEAMTDDHARWQMRINLSQARKHPFGATRDMHLDLAAQWLDHENRRLRHWGAAAEIPEAVHREVAELDRRLTAVHACVDLLETVPELSSPEGAWRWISLAAARYAEQPDPVAFVPLKLAAGSTRETATALAEAIRMSSLVGSVPAERLTVAVLAALPGLDPEARRLVCDLLDILGGEAVGGALFHEFDEARRRPGKQLRELATLVLMAFDNYPELLSHRRFERVRYWFLCLPFRYIWHDSFAPYWEKAALYTDVSPERVRIQMTACVDAVREARDDEGWLLSGLLTTDWRLVEEFKRVADAFLNRKSRRDDDWLAVGYGAS